MPILHEDITIPKHETFSNVSTNVQEFCTNLPMTNPIAIDLRQMYDLTPPTSQRDCGMCWAIAVASIIDDSAVVGGRMRQRPKVSPTVLMTMFPQYGCMGGAVGRAADSIVALGYVLASCNGYDYVTDNKISWCESDTLCSGAHERKNVQGAEGSNPLVNTAIPPVIDCHLGKELLVTDALFFSDDGNINETFHQIKRLVAHNGSLCANVVVYKNFIYRAGKFSHLGGGNIYIDTIDYQYYDTGVPSYKKPLSKRNIVGTHSVCVVGYGVKKNVRLLDGRFIKELPYWIIRNSWGSTWASNGYAKIAMFPFCTKGIAIGVAVTTQVDNETVNIGGMFAVKAGPFSNKPRANYRVQLISPKNKKVDSTSSDDTYDMFLNGERLKQMRSHITKSDAILSGPSDIYRYNPLDRSVNTRTSDPTSGIVLLLIVGFLYYYLSK